MKTITKAGLKIRASVKAGGFGGGNHSRAGLKVRAIVKAGGFGGGNHSRTGLRVKSAVKAGTGLARSNHNIRFLCA